MWEKLRELFQGGGGPPVIIEPVSYEDGLLLFKAEKPLKLVKSKVAAPSKLGYFELELDILSLDEAKGVYRAKVTQNETFNLDAMQMERRREFRLDAKIPIVCAELKGKQAQTEDISLNGARLLIPVPLKPGDFIGVDFHFNDPAVPVLPLRCEVRWCAPTRKGKHHCGVRFFTIEKSDKQKIKRFIENRVALGR